MSRGDATNAIVVGVDASPPARTALRWAVDEAARRGSRLVAVYVWSPQPTARAPYAPAVEHRSSAEERADAERELDQVIRDTCAEIPDVPMVERMESGLPARTLVETACGAQMLVLGARRRPDAGLTLGPVARACLVHAPCPVVLVPVEEVAAVPVGVAG